MKDFVIDQVSWHWDSESEPPARTLTRFKAVAEFLQGNALTTRPLVVSDADVNADFRISSADLTDEGLALIKKVYDRWLTKVDNGEVDPTDMTLFQRALAKLRK